MNGYRAPATLVFLAVLLGSAARADEEAATTEPSVESTGPEPAADESTPAPTAAGEAVPAAPAAAKDAKTSLTAINKVLTNPLSEAWSIALAQNNFRITPGIGVADRWSSRLQFQGAFPVEITPTLDLITRPYIDFFNSQPHPVPGSPGEIDRTTALGDIVVLQILAPRREWVGNWILGVGPTWILPSGTSKWTSTGKWQVGPAGVLGYLSEKWILGALVQDWKSFGGSGPVDLHSMSIQPLAAYFLPNGWSVGYSGSMLANWTSVTGDRYTIPVGLQVGKVVRFGSTPVKFSLAGQWMPVHPAHFGQVWSAQLVLQVLRPKLVKGALSDPANLQFRWEE